MIQVHEIEVLDRDAASRQELDRNFLRSGYRRRLYVAADPAFTWRSRPQRSADPLTLVPIPLDEAADHRLRYLDRDGTVRCVAMTGGRYYYVPPGVPYQVESHGAGVLEVFSPVPASGRLFDEELLPEDFFAAATAEVAGGGG